MLSLESGCITAVRVKPAFGLYNDSDVNLVVVQGVVNLSVSAEQNVVAIFGRRVPPSAAPSNTSDSREIVEVRRSDECHGPMVVVAYYVMPRYYTNMCPWYGPDSSCT